MALPTVLIATGIIIFSFGLLFGFVGFRQIINYKISKNVALLPNSDMRKAWEKVPIPIDFKIYIFNVTNPEQVHNGSKPILQEVGPYFYDEWKEKVKVVDNRTDDTVSFHMKTRWNFNAKRSGSLTGDEILTIPHIAILGMVMAVEIQKPPMLTMINRAIPHIYGNPQTIFLTAHAKEILFEGIVMNCTSKEFAPAAICTFIKQNAKSLHRVSEDIFKFSLFGVKNDTPDEGRFTVKRGIKNYKEVGQVKLFDGEKELKIWSGPKCNALRGTDSTIFAPFIQPGDEIVSFAPDLCRSLGAKYKGPVNYKGIPGYHYTADLGDMSSNEDEKCYCPTPTTCLKKGLFDLTKCTGAPIILTLPHFYETEPSYLDQIIGLKPEKEKHMIYMNFEPITGTPLGARKRLQFNMFIHSVKKIDIMKNMPNALMPLFWVEEGLELDQDFIDLLDGSLFRALRIVGIGRWFTMLIGIGVVGAGVYVHYRRKKLLPLESEPRADRSDSRPVSSMKVADVESVNKY